MHAKNIKRFTHEGEIRDDSDFIRIRAELERLMVQTMRSEGYLPLHDLRSHWSTKWIGKKYSFKLTMYAMYAGPRKAYEFDFYSDWKLVKVDRSVFGTANKLGNSGIGN